MNAIESQDDVNAQLTANDPQIDRKDQISQVYWLTFPHQDGPEYNHSNTVLDGEFVIDVDPQTGAVSTRLLALSLLGGVVDSS